MTDLRSIVVDASRRSGATTSAANACATPSPSNCSRAQCSPSVAAVIEPPDTLETRSSFGEEAELVQPPQRADVEQHRAVAAAREAQRDTGLELLSTVLSDRRRRRVVASHPQPPGPLPTQTVLRSSSSGCDNFFAGDLWLLEACRGCRRRARRPRARSPRWPALLCDRTHHRANGPAPRQSLQPARGQQPTIGEPILPRAGRRRNFWRSSVGAPDPLSGGRSPNDLSCLQPQGACGRPSQTPTPPRRHLWRSRST